jgi:hypothetical protein
LSGGSLLGDELINANKTDGVTAWNIGNGLDFTSHHEHGSLDVLDVQVSLAAWLVVWSQNSDLLARFDSAGENSAESVETTTIGRWHHLGDEDHEGTILVASLNGLTGGIVNWTLIKVGSSVGLSLLGRWELHDDHLKESLSSVNPLLADDLHQILKTALFLLSCELNLESVQHAPNFIEFTVHAGTDQGDD